MAASTVPLKISLPRSMMPILLQMSASSGRMCDDTMIVLLILPEFLEQFAHLDAGARVEAAGRLVEQQHLRVVQQHAGQAEPLRHAARQARDQGVALVAEVDRSSTWSPFLRRSGPLMRYAAAKNSRYSVTFMSS